jgi:M6 family metalloprotease-like protein
VIPDDGEKTMLTNNGKGLPMSGNGVYDVDFTKATYAKNVTELFDYEEGCPTVSTTQSNPAVLVIPVEFSDMTATRNNYSIAKLEKVFNGGIGDTDYYSVHDYFYQSSYGQLDLDITVWDEWIRPTYKSSYYAKQKDNTGDLIGDQMVLNEALAKLEGRLDLSKFDSDDNGVIDAVVLVTTVQINSNNDFNWAFRYYNTYTNEQGSPYIYDKVFAKDYLWIPYSFLHESFNSQGNLYYTDTSVMNPYTFIHEFSHVLGADDYYDTAGKTDPLNCYDVMDSMVGDHNPYTKFNYGWLTSSRLVVADSQITLTLEDFSKNGDTIIIANNWDEKLGVYQEYFLLMYYTNNGLNGGEYGYFNEEGILVYHVNASLYEEIRDGKTHYTIYNNNTAPSAGGTKDNLIEFISRTNNDYVYGVGESLSKDTKDDSGKKVAYTFTVNSLSGGVANLTFTKNA